MRRTVVAAVSLLLTGTACTSGSTSGTPPRTPPRTTSHAHGTTHLSTSAPAASTSSTADSADPAHRALARMTEAQRVGQLLMVDCPSSGVAAATISAIEKYHVGSVILDGNSNLGVARTHAITTQLQGDAPKRVKLFVSTDQEGGLVQRMRGPGFSTIPSAVQQGTTGTTRLRKDAAEWAGQLTRAGINLNLAPVFDTVPDDGARNPPIGDLDREYGHNPATVAKHGLAVLTGFATAGLSATVKHFPGLGRVTGNTDTTSGVTDSVTTRHDPYLAPFAKAVRAGVPFVMMSTAIYQLIDPHHPAAFSSTIVTGMLRGDLHYHGVVISDDLGAAKQVSGYSVGRRAVDFVAAGGDVVLTVDANQAATMTAALLARAAKIPSFKRMVDAAALRVLEAKAARELVS